MPLLSTNEFLDETPPEDFSASPPTQLPVPHLEHRSAELTAVSSAATSSEYRLTLEIPSLRTKGGIPTLLCASVHQLFNHMKQSGRVRTILGR